MIDFDRVFDGLVEAIECSSMGSLLAMLGGRKALLPPKGAYHSETSRNHIGNEGVKKR